MVVTKYVFIHKVEDDKFVLVNGLSGAVDVVETPLVQALGRIRRGEQPDLSPEAVSNLVTRGYVYNSREEEAAAVGRVVAINQARRAKEQAICFVLCPTLACNLRCPYCFEPHKLHETNKVMTTQQVELAFAALDQIRRTRPDMPDASINLFGGEPLLPIAREAVQLILARAAERDLYIAVTTNGTYVDQYVDLLLPYRERLHFDITMDGPKRIHDERRITAGGGGTFDRISANQDRMLAAGFSVSVRMNLSEENIPYIPELIDHIKAKGWHQYETFQLSLSPVTNYTGLSTVQTLPPYVIEDRIRDFLTDELLGEVRVAINGDFSRINAVLAGALGDNLLPGKFMPSIYYCEASGALFYCMGPDGLIYPCNQIIGNPEWAIGAYDPELTIDPDKAALWQGRVVTNIPKCTDCSIAFLCGGGCPVLATRTSQSPMAPYCGTSKQELSGYIRSRAAKLIQTDP